MSEIEMLNGILRTFHPMSDEQARRLQAAWKRHTDAWNAAVGAPFPHQHTGDTPA